MASKRTGGRSTAMIFLFLSFMAATLATVVLYLVYARLEAQLAQVQGGDELVMVVVAKNHIAPGHDIKLEDLELLEVPPAFLPPTIFSDIHEVVDLVPKERILVGEAIRQERLAKPDQGRGLNALIPTGQRAMQLEIRGGRAVAGLVEPGNFIDILLTAVDSKGVQQTKTLFQAKQVLAVDDRLGETDNSQGKTAPSVTLALTPEEVQILTHARLNSQLTLSLRNNVDVTQQVVHGVRPETFIGAKNHRFKVTDIPQRTRRPKPKPKPSKTLIISGGRIEKTQLER